MTNTILATISRFWLEVNAHAWRYCPEAVQQRLDAAYATFARELRDLLLQQRDADFGRGWREGHDAGQRQGWADRDAEAQRELARKNDQIQALMTLLESYRMQWPAEPAPPAEGNSTVEDREIERIGLMPPRLPVH